MNVDADSFAGKLYLLLIDKIIIGAIIAVAFVLYDQYRTTETRRYETISAQAKLAREFLPAIVDSDLDPLSRLFLLRAGVRGGALDAETAIYIGQSSLASQVPEVQFRRVMSELIPKGIPAVGSLGISFTKAIDDHADKHDGQGQPKEWEERELWRSMLIDVIPAIESVETPFSDETLALQANFFGLFLLIGPRPGEPLSEELLISSSGTLNLIGAITMLRSKPDDSRAIRRVDKGLFAGRSSSNEIRLANEILKALEWRKDRHIGASGTHACGAIAKSIAQIATEPALPSHSFEHIRVAHYHLRQRAILALAAMGSLSTTWDFGSAGCVEDAVPVLASYLNEFIAAVDQPYDKAQTAMHESKYGHAWPQFVGMIAADILACHPAAEAQQVTRDFVGIGEDKLRRLHPFLYRNTDCRG